MPRAPKKNETDLLHALVVSEENERALIAKQIHQVNTLLSLVKLNLRKAARQPQNKELHEQLFHDNYAALDESMQIISHSVRELAPPMFSSVGYVAALDELCRLSNKEGKSVHLEILTHAHTHITAQSELHLYRLSKELLECLLRDAAAHIIHITLSGTKEKQVLRFTHDGKELKACKTAQYSIEARALLAGAKMKQGKEWVQIEIGNGKKN